jgi:serralysin
MEDNRWCFAWFIQETGATGAFRQGLAKGSKWTSGDTITISFLDGDDALKEKVKKYAREWTELANLNFGFIEDTTDTMVRISFQFSGNWSLIGRDCLRRTNLELPTMNLELSSNSPEDLIRRKVLHEFGHVVGMLHEHQIPENGIKWNRERVIGDLSGPPNSWSAAEIEENVLRPAETQETNFIKFDPHSIMIYPISANWTDDGFAVGWNTELSQNDKDFIRNQYL